MDAAVLQALARLHGLDPETATEDQVNAAVLAAPPTPDPEAPETPEAEVPDPEVPAVPEPVAASEAVTLRTTLGLPASATDAQVANAAAELRAGVQEGRTARRAQVASELDADVDKAVLDGRIAPSARDAWRSAIDAGDNPDAASTARATAERQRLAAMATGRVPVSERGSMPDPTAAPAASLNRALAAAGVHTNGRSGAAQREVIRRG